MYPQYLSISSYDNSPCFLTGQNRSGGLSQGRHQDQLLAAAARQHLRWERAETVRVRAVRDARHRHAGLQQPGVHRLRGERVRWGSALRSQLTPVFRCWSNGKRIMRLIWTWKSRICIANKDIIHGSIMTPSTKLRTLSVMIFSKFLSSSNTQ